MQWKALATLALGTGCLAAALSDGAANPANAHPGAADGDGAGSDSASSRGLHADIHTSRGVITARLDFQRAPLATAAFVGLAEGTIENDAFPEGRPYYDGSVFHRVVPGHVIQAGEPDSAEASDPGFTYPNEIHADLSHDRAGVLGVANAGPHTNSGQFYITLDDRSYLDGMYIVFGEVVDGMEVVRSVREGDRVDSVRITREGSDAKAFRPDTRSFHQRVEEAEERVEAHREKRRRAQEEWLRENLPALEGNPEEVRTAPLQEAHADLRDPAPGGGAAADGGVPVRYRGTALEYRGDLRGHDGPPLREIPFVSGPSGEPAILDSPKPFRAHADEAEIPPGLEEALAPLEAGEGRLAVVPPELGYGSSGFFGPEPDDPGRSRLVIPPEALLVYRVAVAGQEP